MDKIKAFFKKAPWTLILAGWVGGSLVLVFVVEGKVVWTDWLIGFVGIFLVVYGIHWFVNKVK